MRSLALAVLTLAFLPAAAAAGPFEDGASAYDAGNYAAAMELWRPLAKQGHAAAQFEIGQLYANGWGIAQSWLEAMKWYRRAADQGNARAQYFVAGMYAQGHGVPPNRAKALEWHQKAAERGDAAAQHDLGVMYAGGTRQQRDLVKSYAWLCVAVANEIRGARQKRDRVLEHLNEDQIGAAKRLAAEYLEKYGPK